MISSPRSKLNSVKWGEPKGRVGEVDRSNDRGDEGERQTASQESDWPGSGRHKSQLCLAVTFGPKLSLTAPSASLSDTHVLAFLLFLPPGRSNVRKRITEDTWDGSMDTWTLNCPQLVKIDNHMLQKPVLEPDKIDIFGTCLPIII